MTADDRHPTPEAAVRCHQPRAGDIRGRHRTRPSALCAKHLLKSYERQRLHPDLRRLQPDRRSGLSAARELTVALTGLHARGYKNSTLLFNLARVFIARSPAAARSSIPPWTGIAEPMWEPVQIRHRSAYYDAFFVEALLSYMRIRAKLVRPEET
jgi:hypothetical protein